VEYKKAQMEFSFSAAGLHVTNLFILNNILLEEYIKAPLYISKKNRSRDIKLHTHELETCHN